MSQIFFRSMFSGRIEISYAPIKSMRSFRIWLIHGWICDTPAVGPDIGFRLLGFNVHSYFWRYAKRSDYMLKGEKE